MNRLCLMLLFLTITATAFSQETNQITNQMTNTVSSSPDEVDTRVKGEIKWNNKLTAGFSLTSGNSALMNLSAGLSLNRNRLWINEYDFKAMIDWRTDENVKTYLKISSLFRYGHSFTKKFYGFVGISAKSDYAALIDYNLYPNLGVGYWFFDTGRIKLMNELGTAYNYYLYLDQTTSENLGLYYKLFLEWKIWPEVIWSETFSIKPAWADFSDFVLKNISQIKIKIKKDLDLTLTHTYDFDNIPAAGAEKSDVSFVTGLEWKF